MALRSVLAFGALAVALLAAGAVAWYGAREPTGESGDHEVTIVGPANATLFLQAVHVENATAYGALVAAARAGNLTVDSVEYSGMGVYVRAVGGFEARGAAGWVYEVRRDGAWVFGDRSAERYALAPGEAVRWSWTDG